MSSEEKKPAKKATKIIVGTASVILGLIIATAAVIIFLYKSGEASLKASATTIAPTVEVDEQAKLDFEYANTIPWQDGWVAYDDKVYSYNEDMLNFLVLGIDKHGELSSDENFIGYSVGQADAVFLISLNPDDKTVSVIAVPRNSMVNLECYNTDKELIKTYYNELCLQYSYAGGGEFGLTKMKERVSEIFSDLPIHGACAINMDAIGVVVDMLGGIEVTIPDDMTELDPSFVEGSTLKLTKKNAWLYLKYRDMYSLGSPTTRLTRQKEFMKTAINVAIDRVKSDPMIVSDIYEAIMQYMNTDISLDEAVYLAKQALDYSVTDDSFYQLTGEDQKEYFTMKDGSEAYYDNYFLDEDAIEEVLMKVFYTPVVLDEAQ